MFVKGMHIAARFAHGAYRGNRIPREGLAPASGQGNALVAGSLADRCATPATGIIVNLEG